MYIILNFFLKFSGCFQKFLATVSFCHFAAIDRAKTESDYETCSDLKTTREVVEFEFCCMNCVIIAEQIELNFGSHAAICLAWIIEEGILATFCCSFISGATNRKPLQLLNVTKQLTVYSTFPSLLPPLPINYGMSFASCCYLTCFVRYWDCRQHCDRAFPVRQLTECTTVLFTEAWLCRAMHCVQPSVTECLL